MKTIFFSIDNQINFHDKESENQLYVEDAENIHQNLERLTNYAGEQGFQVINTADLHTMDDEEISEDPDFITKFPPHCMRGTKGAEFIEATKPLDSYVVDFLDENVDIQEAKYSRNITLYKKKFDMFSGNQYCDELVDELKPMTAVVYGLATNVCVDFAVMGLLERDITVYVVQDAIKELPQLPLEETLDKWKDAGAKFVTTYDVTKPGGLGAILNYAAFDLEDECRFDREQRAYTE